MRATTYLLVTLCIVWLVLSLLVVPNVSFNADSDSTTELKQMGIANYK